MGKEYKNILQFAIERERDAYDFYTKAKEHVKTSNARTFFDQLAKQELAHKQKLESMSISKELLIDLSSLDIASYTLDEQFADDMQFHMEYQQILLLAIKREEMSVRLYKNMRMVVKEPDKQQLFGILMQEEQSHREELQIEYDAYVLTED
ncbi:MAG: ferritin family protein [Deltaproteobacteria bacterium]|nr:ferritin family protein [Deltaproteobacteria bacterium]MCL5276836.1 ferritin family protein [Deltaproteobacteria bacterium]